MEIILNGHNFKYELEATVKLFVFAQHFEFVYDNYSGNYGDEFILTELKENGASAYIKADISYQGKNIGKSADILNEKKRMRA